MQQQLGFYRALHISAKRGIAVVIPYVRPSVCLSVCNVRALLLNRIMFSETNITTN